MKDDNGKEILKQSIELAYKEYAEEPMASFYEHPVIGIPSRFRIRKIARCLEQVRGRVLEVGCEAGYVCRYLSNTIKSDIFGLDPCFPALLDFKTKGDFPDERVCICSSIAQEICFQSGTFDAVICTEVLEHTPGIDGIFAEISRVLKNEGIFILTLPYERLRKKLYPIIKHFGINTDVEKEVNLFNYEREVIEEKLGLTFSIGHFSPIFRFFPITYFYYCKKK